MKSILLKNDDGETVRLSKFPAVFGRTDDAAVHLTNVLASRIHCEIVSRPDGLAIRDLGSVNGTLVNGEPINVCHADGHSCTEIKLRDGDEIIIGSSLFTVLQVDSQELATQNSRLNPTRRSTVGERIIALLRLRERQSGTVHQG